MQDGISKQDLKLFRFIVQNLVTVIKNSTLYPATHPISEFSLKNFKTSLDDWFAEKETLEIGITPYTLILGGSFPDKTNELYREVASYFHSRGVAAVSFLKGLEISELQGMFKFLRKNAKLAREGQVSEEQLPDLGHISVKLLDYSELLASAAGESLSEEDEKVWKALTDVHEGPFGEDLPHERKDFILDFLKDAKRSAAVLNRVYREAVMRLEGDEAVRQARQSIARIYDYLSTHPAGIPGSARVDIGKILSRLDPDLLVRLFSSDKMGDNGLDLASEMMKDVPDDFVAGFVESLIKNSGGFDEYLLKVFERLSPGGQKGRKMASLVAGRLCDPRAFAHESLAEIQMAMGEILTTHPHSEFLSQVYDLTLEAIMERKAAKMNLPKSLVSMAEAHLRDSAESGFKGIETELLLNLLWHENDPVFFGKLSGRLINLIPNLIEARDTLRLRFMFSFFFEDARKSQKEDFAISREVRRCADTLRGESVVRGVTALLAGSVDKNAEDAVFMLEKIKSPEMAGMVLDEFCSERKESRRKNIMMALEKFTGRELDVLADRINISGGEIAAELFTVLRGRDPERSRILMFELMKSGSSSARMEILESFVPETPEEKRAMRSALKREKDGRLRRKVMAAIFKTGDRAEVSDLFHSAGKLFANREFLLELIEMAGETSAQEAVPALARFVTASRFFGPSEKIKLAAVVSLGRIRNDEALEVIREAEINGSHGIRSICGTILSLEPKSPGAIEKES